MTTNRADLLAGHKMLKGLFERLEQIPDSTLLLVHAGLGGFVLLEHGGALLIVLRGTAPVPPGYAAMIRTLAPFSLLIAWLVVSGSVFGFVRPRSRRFVLAAQALILLLSGTGLLAWASRIVVGGIPDVNFGWTPGLLTGCVVYSVFLCARFVLPAGVGTIPHAGVPGRDSRGVHRVRGPGSVRAPRREDEPHDGWCFLTHMALNEVVIDENGRK